MGTMKALLNQGAGLNIHFEGEQCYGSALLTHHAVGALAETSYFHYARYNPFIGAAISSANSKISCSKGLHHSPPWRGQGGFNNYHLLQQTGPKRWQCRLHDSSSSDDEYRSSRNIAISLFKRYRNFVERGGGDNLKDFITAGVNAYALGCTDEGLRKELIDMKQSGVEVEAMHGGNTSLKLKISSNEIDECIFWLSIIFITILCTPQPTIVRWSPTPSVSDEILLRWKGFCALIANAYFVRGMAWLPVKTLQLEQMAVVGRSEEPSVVASRMRLVFTTLEVVSPQWPRA